MRAHFGLPSVKSGKFYGLCVPLGLRMSSKTRMLGNVHPSPSNSRYHTLRFQVSKYVILRSWKKVATRLYHGYDTLRKMVTTTGINVYAFPSLLLLNSLLVFALLWKRAVLPLCQCDLVVSISCILAIKGLTCNKHYSYCTMGIRIKICITNTFLGHVIF